MPSRSSVRFQDEPRALLANHHARGIGIPADAWQPMPDRDMELFQFLARPNTGQHQQVRRIDRPTAEDDFLPAVQYLPAAILHDVETDGPAVGKS